jgi:hypothetical protein
MRLSHPAGEPAKECCYGVEELLTVKGLVTWKRKQEEEISKVEEADKAEGTGYAKVDSAYDAANREGGGREKVKTLHRKQISALQCSFTTIRSCRRCCCPG